PPYRPHRTSSLLHHPSPSPMPSQIGVVVTDDWPNGFAMGEQSYGVGLDNARSDEERRLAGAQELFDPPTFRHLDTIGITTGMRCLEVGGGAGSVARH